MHYTAAAIGDYDNDGDMDIFLSTADRIHLYLNRGDGSFVDDPRLEAGVRDLSPDLLKNIDYDNDGFVDLWVSGKDGMFLFRNDGTGQFAEPYPLIETVTPTEGQRSSTTQPLEQSEITTTTVISTSFSSTPKENSAHCKTTVGIKITGYRCD